MPRKETVFYCDICGRKYGCEKDAGICEKSHFSIAEVKARYDKDDRKKEYPTTLLVTLGDGKSIEYSRKRTE